MTFAALLEFLAMGTSPGQNSAPPLLNTFVPLLLMVFVLYFILIRPQQKKAREQEALLKSLRPKDKILTSSGIIGVIVDVKERSVSIRSADSKFEVLKSAIVEITERSGEPSEVKREPSEAKT